MASRDWLVDTSGLYALLAPADSAHQPAVELLKQASQAKRVAVITDYVLSETATLLMARKARHLAQELFDMTEQSRALRIVRVDAEQFDQAKRIFLKHFDHQYSFTDCVSFAIMRELELTEALTTDRHFQEMGFAPLLATAGQ